MAKGQGPRRPGSEQRRRCVVATGLALVVWGLRWLWPLQVVPGWLVAGLLVWAFLEVAALLLAPRRWR
jgi:hypothetical protein